MKEKMTENATRFLLIMALIAFLIGSLFLYKGHNVKENYSNSDYYSENAYVGGDAYNYIINGTYFTAYAVMGMGFYIISSIAFTGSFIILAASGDAKKEELPQI